MQSGVYRESQQHKWSLDVSDSKKLQFAIEHNDQSLFPKGRGDTRAPNGPSREPTGEIPAVPGATQPPSLGCKHPLTGTFFFH